jgi:hypothetical protein
MENTAPRLFQAHHGDYVVLAIFNTPTEAYIVKGCLEASGIHAVIADDNLVQADSLLTVALGGVRLRVQEKKLLSARQVLADFHRGAFSLNNDDADFDNQADPDIATEAATPAAPTTILLCSPDSVALWSLLFTPIFGSVMHVFNASRLGKKSLLYSALCWLALNTYLTNYIVWHTPKGGNMLETLFNQSSALLPLMAVWYLLGVRTQSRYVITHYGAHYPRQALWLALCIGAILTLLRLDAWPPD